MESRGDETSRLFYFLWDMADKLAIKSALTAHKRQEAEMPEPNTGLGQGAAAPQGQGTDVKGANASPVQGQGQGQPWLGTWNTKEDAEKGIADLKRIGDEARSRADKAESMLDTQGKLLDKLTTALQTKQTVEPAPKTEAELEAEHKKLIEELSDPDNGPEFQIRLIQSAMRDAELRATKESEKRFNELMGRYEKLEKLVADQAPDYVANRERITEIQKEFAAQGINVDRNTAIAIAKREALKAAPNQPPRPGIPGTTATETGTSHEPQVELTEDEVSMLESSPYLGKLSDKEKEFLRNRKKKMTQLEKWRRSQDER